MSTPAQTTANQTSTSGLDRYTTYIKDTITILAGIAALGYGAGFLIVSSDLLSWHIPDLTLVRARYVSVGILFLFHIFLVLGLAAFSMRRLIDRIYEDDVPSPESDSPQPASAPPASPTDSAASKQTTSIPAPLKLGRLRSKKRVIRAILISLLILCFAMFCSLFLFYRTNSNIWIPGEPGRFWTLLRHNYLLILCTFYLPLLASGLLLPLVGIGIARNKWLFGIPNRLWLIGIILLCYLVAVKSYTDLFYPYTASAVGGGDFYAVQLVAEPGKAETLKQLLYMNPNNTNITKRVWLLDQNDKAYFVLLPYNDYTDLQTVDYGNFHAVQVDKSLIIGIIHH